ncbi:cellulase family glycosylhydrolase [Mycobacterium deserti]|uniref:Cellulase family glycosylhydrolase n=1 Tax=Mycobacterium deserti TaxID=2978347 RepID=A0ABT2MCD1_9MYCO|nr:cellulase family glycosylhydrolase [Mycobacterium deserti]MCT7659922.1 cellulase family glycosylhydrolase [Mycobacterium deserti]
MRRDIKRRIRRYAIATVIAAAPAAVLCAYVTNLLVPTEPVPRQVSYEYIPTAVINESNETIGIADSDIYGLSLPNGQMDTAMIDKHLTEMQKLGVNTVRVLIPWADIQPVPPGQFPTPEWEESMWTRSQYIIDKASSLGMGVLGVLNTTPAWGDDPDEPGYGIYTPPDPDLYAAWAATVAERFQGKVSAYEIWNEPNYAAYWTAGPDPAHYTEILKAAYAAIKGVDDEALVVAGVLGTVQNSGVTMNPVSFIEQMYANDAKGFFDALSIHPYNYQVKFSQGLDPTNQWQTPLEQLIAIRQLMLANGDEELKIWATEYGLSTTITDEATQAAWVKDFLDTWKDLDYTGPAFLYTLRDRLNTTTEEGSMGIFRYDWGRKLVADVICQATGACEDPGEEPGENPPNPGEALAQAIQAIVQQLYTVVAQAFTQLANQIVSAITEALSNLFSAVNPAPAIADVPTEARLAIASAVTTATAEVTGEETPVDALNTAPAGEPAPDAGEAEVPQPEVTEPEVTEPVLTEPEVTEPEVTEPEVTQPEVTEPEVTEPEVTEPEVTEEPEATETEDPVVDEADEPLTSDEPETSDEPKDESDSRDDNESPSGGDAKADDDASESDGPGNADANGSTGNNGGAGANGSGGGAGSGSGAGSAGGAGSGGIGGSDGGGGSGGSDGGGSGGSDNVGYLEPGHGYVISAA